MFFKKKPEKSNWTFTPTACINLSNVTLIDLNELTLTFHFGAEQNLVINFKSKEEARADFNRIRGYLDSTLLE